jgi:AcrR family transcriptional regulator
MTTSAAVLSAQGTKLNRRGQKNREAILNVAIRCLASEGSDGMSANRIAKEAGVTWGTIQHQFGDKDGVWAAVLKHAADEVTSYRLTRTESHQSLARRVSATVEWMRRALESAPARAVQTVRTGLPRHPGLVAREYPKTLAALELVDDAWSALIDDMLEGLVASRAKRERVRQLLPAAMHGIQMQAELSSMTDAAAARRGLAEALTAYLEA